MKLANKKANRIDMLQGKLQKNLGFFNQVVSNIKSLNDEIDIEITSVNDEIAAKQAEISQMAEIKSQNDRIKNNFEKLLV